MTVLVIAHAHVASAFIEQLICIKGCLQSQNAVSDSGRDQLVYNGCQQLVRGVGRHASCIFSKVMVI